MDDYTRIFDKIIRQYTAEELEQICKALNKAYNIYDSEEHKWTQLRYVLSKTPPQDIACLQDTQISNRVINDLIFKFYPCERVVKYYLIKKLKSLSDHIVAFEMSIGNSRIDLCRINGYSYAYEIKTAYDTFDRLETQMRDYTEAFEKVYLVIPFERKENATHYIPNNCGIITYRTTISGEFCFHYYRKASTNTCSIQKCANSLSSAELSTLLKLLKVKNIPTQREAKLNALFMHCKGNFWTLYKNLLKDKYASKWEFLVCHFHEILPIDIQNFFSTSLDPNLAYYVQKARPS